MHNPRDEQPAIGPDHVRAALAIRRPPDRPPSPALANDAARKNTRCPHCHAQPGEACTVASTGRALSDGAVHPARLASTAPSTSSTPPSTSPSTTDPNRSQP